MITSALRWTLPLLAILIVGPLAGWLTASLHAPDGSGFASLLVGTSMTKGLVAGVGVLLLAGVMGIATSRMIGAHFGLFCAGVVIAWGAWGTATIDQLVRARPGLLVGGANGTGSAGVATGLFTTLSLEAAFLAPFAVAIAWAIILVGRKPAPDSPHHPEPQAIRDSAAWIGLLAAMVVGGLIVWLVAQDTRKGQTFGAAAIAGLGAAAAGRLTATRISAAVFVAGLALLAIASPVSALVIHGTGIKPLLAAQAGTLFRLARPLPLDWIAGAFVGVPLGLTWAGSMLEQHKHK